MALILGVHNYMKKNSPNQKLYHVYWFSTLRAFIILCIKFFVYMYLLFSHVYLLFYNHRSSYTGLVHGSIPGADSSKYRRVSLPSKTGPRLDEIKKSLRSKISNDCLQLLYGSAKHVYVL